MKRVRCVFFRPTSHSKPASCIACGWKIRARKSIIFHRPAWPRRRKVEAHGRDGKPVAEIKGVIREIEVFPGGVAEWWFVLLKTGSFDDLKCTIKGHAEAGMTGKIEIR